MAPDWQASAKTTTARLNFENFMTTQTAHTRPALLIFAAGQKLEIRNVNLSWPGSIWREFLRSPELVCVVMVSTGRARFLEQKAVTHCCCAVVAVLWPGVSPSPTTGHQDDTFENILQCCPGIGKVFSNLRAVDRK